MPTLTPHTTTRRAARTAAPLLVAIALAFGCLAAGAQRAEAATALGCSFTASTPYLSNGHITTALSVRCGRDTALYWHGRLTKSDFFRDTLAGSSDGYHIFPAGRTVTWVLRNNVRGCPGTGWYFGKLSIQAGSFSTAYVHRSLNSYLIHC